MLHVQIAEGYSESETASEAKQAAARNLYDKIDSEIELIAADIDAIVEQCVIEMVNTRSYSSEKPFHCVREQTTSAPCNCCCCVPMCGVIALNWQLARLVACRFTSIMQNFRFARAVHVRRWRHIDVV